MNGKNRLQVECFVEAEPEAEVTWFKDLEEISEDNLIHNQYGLYSIQIQSVDSNDFYGNYSCHAQNSLGEVSKHVQVISGLAKMATFKSNPRGRVSFCGVKLKVPFYLMISDSIVLISIDIL